MAYGGAGYSSYEAILKNKPNFIKIDMGIRDVQTVNQQIAKALVAINNLINAVIIAEGIQSIEKGRKLKELGLTWDQSFLENRALLFRLLIRKSC